MFDVIRGKHFNYVHNLLKKMSLGLTSRKKSVEFSVFTVKVIWIPHV